MSGVLGAGSGTLGSSIGLSELDVPAVKGGLLVGDGVGSPVELAVGTDTHVLTADSAQASGVKWAVGGGGGLANVVEDVTPQLGGDLDMNAKGIDFPTTANVTDCLDEDTLVSDSATMLATQQSIKAYVDNTATAITKTIMTVYNDSGSTITEGKCVYTSGWKAGNEVPTIALAKSDSSSTMPCIGVVDADILNNAEGVIVVLGTKTTFDTSAWNTNDKLYIDPTTAGDMTTTKPVAANLIQKVGHVLRDHASLGSMVVSGAYRSNDVPNFTAADKYWYGGTSGVATEGAVTAFARTILDDANEAAFKATVNLEANTDFYAPSGTDVAVADGGTGSSTAAAALIALGATPIVGEYDLPITASDGAGPYAPSGMQPLAFQAPAADPGMPWLQGDHDPDSTTTRGAQLPFRIPRGYVAATHTLTIRINAEYLTAAGTSTKVDCRVYLNGAGADDVSTASQALTAAPADYDFAVTDTGYTAGDLITVAVESVAVDASATAAVTAYYHVSAVVA